MARPDPATRMQQILDAAGAVFEQKGLERTRMSDVAETLGVSQGTLYYYFEGKEALYFTVLKRGARPGPVEVPEQLPVPNPAHGELTRLIEVKLKRAFKFPRIDAALKSTDVIDPREELQGVVAEAYDKIHRGRVSGNILQRCAIDDPELSQAWFNTQRRGLVKRLSKYIEARVRAGHFTRPPSVQVAARMLVESVTYFGRGRYHDPDCDSLTDDDAIRATVIQLVSNGLLAGPPLELGDP